MTTGDLQCRWLIEPEVLLPSAPANILAPNSIVNARWQRWHMGYLSSIQKFNNTCVGTHSWILLFFPARCQMHTSTCWPAFDSTDSPALVFNLWFLDPCNLLHSGYGPTAWKHYQWTGSSEKRKPSSSSSACFPVQLAVTLLPSLHLYLFLSLTHTQVLALFSQSARHQFPF